MFKKIVFSFSLFFIAFVAYLFIAPNPVESVAWEAPKDTGFSGAFTANDRLQEAQLIDLPQGLYGPESIAIRADGSAFFPSHQGHILILPANSTEPQIWTQIDGHPLGMVFDQNQNLIIADAALGLIQLAPDKTMTILSNTFDGKPYGFVDDVDIADDGKIYFSDASSKPWISELGVPPYRASQYDIMEHGGHGRLFVYDPATQTSQLLLDGLQFSNGIAVSKNNDFVLVNQTGLYEVTRFWLQGDKAGTSDSFISNLPGLPDNITPASDGSYWLALIMPRNPALDLLSGSPRIRNALANMPAFLLPVGNLVDHVVHLSAEGEVLASYQDQSARIGQVTSAVEFKQKLYLGSLSADKIGILDIK